MTISEVELVPWHMVYDDRANALKYLIATGHVITEKKRFATCSCGWRKVLPPVSDDVDEWATLNDEIEAHATASQAG